MTGEKRLPSRGSGKPSLIACLHLLPLPGSPDWAGSMPAVLDRALREAEIFVSAGAAGMILENTHDLPYLKRAAEPPTVAAMSVVATEVRRRTPLPLGIQVLAGANEAALEIAHACDLDFIRVEGFAYAHVADEGLIEADAGRLLRRRAALGAGKVEVWADIKKKHSSHALTADLSLREMAEGALFFHADGVIVTGGATGQPASLSELQSIAGLPLRRVVGSGIDAGNIADFAPLADVLIVGSALKHGGDWRNEVDPDRVRQLTGILHSL